MGLTMKEKQVVTREYKTRYQAVTKKAKSALLDEFTRLTGYHRTCAAQGERGKPRQTALFPEKPYPHTHILYR